MQDRYAPVEWRSPVKTRRLRSPADCPEGRGGPRRRWGKIKVPVGGWGLEEEQASKGVEEQAAQTQAAQAKVFRVVAKAAKEKERRKQPHKVRAPRVCPAFAPRINTYVETWCAASSRARIFVFLYKLMLTGVLFIITNRGNSIVICRPLVREQENPWGESASGYIAHL